MRATLPAPRIGLAALYGNHRCRGFPRLKSVTLAIDEFGVEHRSPTAEHGLAGHRMVRACESNICSVITRS